MYVDNLFNGLAYIRHKMFGYDNPLMWNKKCTVNRAKDRIGGLDLVRSLVRKHQNFSTFQPPEWMAFEQACSLGKRDVDDFILGPQFANHNGNK